MRGYSETAGLSWGTILRMKGRIEDRGKVALHKAVGNGRTTFRMVRGVR